MKDTNKIIHAIESLESFGWEGSKAADVWERIAKISLERYAMEMDSIGNAAMPTIDNLVEEVKKNF